MLVIVTLTDGSHLNFLIYYLISDILSIKCTSKNFSTGDQTSGQFCDHSIISQWEKIERRLFWTKTILNTLKHRVTSNKTRRDTLNQKIATSGLMSPRSFDVMKVTSSFLAITFDNDKVER